MSEFNYQWQVVHFPEYNMCALAIVDLRTGKHFDKDEYVKFLEEIGVDLEENV